MLCKSFGEIICKRVGEMLCKRLGETLYLNFTQASRMIQEILNLSQLPSPDECLVYMMNIVLLTFTSEYVANFLL